MAKVYDLLAAKEGPVHTVAADASVLDATRLMNEHHIGSLVVTGDDREHVVGMFTERDVLQRIVAAGVDPAITRVADVMTEKVVCCTADHDLNDVRAILRNRNIRHLPVVAPDGKLVGLVSIGDLNAHSIQTGQVTIQYLEEYIYGRA